MDLFTIVLKDESSVDPRKYGALLAPALGVTVHDARMAIRRGGGIVAEDIPEEHARRIAESLEADGVGCWCVASAALPTLPAPRRVTGLEVTADGVRGALLNQPQPVDLPWDRIGVVSIGLVTLPELEEIAGVRKKDVAAVLRVEQEQRDFVRDRLLSVLTRVDLSHEENAPAPGAHHYFFDQLRRNQSMQLKAFADLVSDDGPEWWRLPLEESGFAADRGLACNYMAVPVIYERRKDAHTDRSRQLLQGGNVERLAFHTMEEFNRYTRWWTLRDRLRAEPELAEASKTPSLNGNGQAPPVMAEPRVPAGFESAPAKPKWRFLGLAAVVIAAVAVAAGLKFERRGAECMLCKKLRQDDVLRLWGFPLRENLGDWKSPGPSTYDEIIGKDHEHLYDGFGFEQTGLFGTKSTFGRAPGGNASPEDADACECANSLLEWQAMKQATIDEVKEAYPRVFERVRNIRDPEGRRRWLELARAQPDREAPENLLKEISK